ncbi:MAG: hypothetical protein SF029_12295 [bacterium]|nr:hypothetical protein [bacterium]
MTIQVEQTASHGWPNCVRLANDRVELIITTDVGPRIIHFGFVGGENQFAEFADQLGEVDGDEWRIYGGHRLWHAPEEQPRTYAPDNQPVTLEVYDDMVKLIQPVESMTGIQKEIDIFLNERAAVRVVHRLRNRNLWPVELSVWALSAMAPGGTAILPLPPRGSHAENLLPTNTLTLWAYTRMNDPRWTWGERYVLLRHADDTWPQKIGAMVPDGWVGFVRNGALFVKAFDVYPSMTYPDLGSAVELFTINVMTEVETLSPLYKIVPGGLAVHEERWFLFDDVATPRNDADVERDIMPRVDEALMAGEVEP